MPLPVMSLDFLQSFLCRTLHECDLSKQITQMQSQALFPALAPFACLWPTVLFSRWAATELSCERSLKYSVWGLCMCLLSGVVIGVQFMHWGRKSCCFKGDLISVLLGLNKRGKESYRDWEGIREGGGGSPISNTLSLSLSVTLRLLQTKSGLNRSLPRPNTSFIRTKRLSNCFDLSCHWLIRNQKSAARITVLIAVHL